MNRGSRAAIARAAMLVVALAMPAASSAQSAGDPQTDLIDLLRRLRHKPVDDDAAASDRTLVIAPVVGWNPTFGATIGAAGQLTFRHGGSDATRLSSGIGSISYSTKKQVLISIRFGVFTDGNRWFVEGDNRFYLSGQDVYGLGTNTPSANAVSTKYTFIRIRDTVYRSVANDVYVGGGVRLDSHSNVRTGNDNTEQFTQSPYVTYSDAHSLPVTSQQSVGVNANLLIDKRDGQINPRSGWLAAAAYQTAWNGFLGGDSSWRALHVEARGYTPVRSERSRLAAWMFGDFSWGAAPYFDLPGTVMDLYGRSARGYVEGRYRGERQLYAELEFRTTLTRNGLVGAVAFANAATFTNLESGERLFDSLAPSAGAGIRILLSKRSRTNLCVDVAFGKQQSHGVYFALQEAF